MATDKPDYGDIVRRIVAVIDARKHVDGFDSDAATARDLEAFDAICEILAQEGLFP